MKPLDPRLVREARATTGYLILVVALATFATFSTVAIAFSFASFVVEIFVNGNSLDSQWYWLGYSLIAAAIRALIHFAQEWAGFFAAGKVKQELRTKALKRIEVGGSEFVSRYGTGELSTLLGSGLDAIDIYFSKYLPQLVFTALVTPALTVLIWYFDAPSGITVLLTLPLIPLFMVMIGLATRDLQDKQLQSLQRLNGHFLEIIKGLITLKIFNRVERQEAVLLEVSEQYRKRTMKVLRLSFLSGFALELAASLSVALLAVSIGIRLVDGQMELFTGLFILIIAPEVYLPLRNVGAQFHAAAGGVAVSSKVLDLIQEPHAETAVEDLEIKAGLTVLVGPSGVGKSLRLKASRTSESTWMPQTSTLFPGTVRENIVGESQFNDSHLIHALGFAQIADLDLNDLVTEDSLSGGQRQRVALARAIYHLLQIDSKLLLLDEPTSQIDTATSEQIVSNLMKLSATGVRIVAATHSRQLIEAADQVVVIDA